MDDVAKAAGVSKITVSNVVNGRNRVGAPTRLRVLQAIDELGYEVNLAARYLRVGRTGAIGLLVPELERPYFGQLARRLADRVESHGMHLAVERTGALRERQLSSVAKERVQLYDGVVLSVTGLTPDDLRRIELGRPALLIGERDVPATFDHVLMDNVGGARLAVGHLLASGARHVAMVGGTLGRAERDVVTLRTEGWRTAHEDAGVAADPALVVELDELDMGAARDAVQRLLTERPEVDGILAITDVVGFGVLRGLADVGRSVPGDVQVVGFDNVDEGEFSVPRLSSVEPDNDAMADAIVELLLRRIGSPDPVEPQVVMPVPRLVLRESTR
ncbi:LacI family DNA-binding transcriptional regulator [Cellulomonas sp. ICMP 17802]|uniref:LacI family DNA-binding transcriptional regulator n=1 Tax=Cellulomonas sp. ICMP 17802 TaxID=3239199 RepID=UPI00351BA911